MVTLVETEEMLITFTLLMMLMMTVIIMDITETQTVKEDTSQVAVVVEEYPKDLQAVGVAK